MTVDVGCSEFPLYHFLRSSPSSSCECRAEINLFDLPFHNVFILRGVLPYKVLVSGDFLLVSLRSLWVQHHLSLSSHSFCAIRP